MQSATSTQIPTIILSVPKIIISPMSTGTIISKTYMPSMERTNIEKGLTRTPFVCITAMPKTFLPIVCPFLKQIGIMNSRINIERKIPIDVIIIDNAGTKDASFTNSGFALRVSEKSLLASSLCSSIMAFCSSVNSLYSFSVTLKSTPYFSLYFSLISVAVWVKIVV